MDLCTFAVVFVLTSEPLIFEAVENLRDRFGGLSQHGLQWDTGLKLAMVLQFHDTMFCHRRNNNFVARQLTGFPLLVFVIFHGLNTLTYLKTLLNFNSASVNISTLAFLPLASISCTICA